MSRPSAVVRLCRGTSTSPLDWQFHFRQYLTEKGAQSRHLTRRVPPVYSLKHVWSADMNRKRLQIAVSRTRTISIGSISTVDYPPRAALAPTANTRPVRATALALAARLCFAAPFLIVLLAAAFVTDAEGSNAEGLGRVAGFCGSRVAVTNIVSGSTMLLMNRKAEAAAESKVAEAS